MKYGAYDYVTKPLYHEEILLKVQEALTKSKNKISTSSDNTTTTSSPAKKKSQQAPQAKYVRGESSKAQQLFQYVDIVAPTDMTVIVYGETGTGKEAIARAIHDQSQRSKGRFIAIDCGALPKDIAASELFGHKKGSFTGAVTDKIGHIELANGGTLFLDEIGNLSYEVQVQLLRALQERKVKRVGDTRDIKVDVRIIVATNEDLMKAMKDGDFREDLYHRLNEFTIHLPPLREREEDIPIFADYFLTQANSELNKAVEGFDKDVMNYFKNYEWPGNLREFKNVIKRSTLLTKGNYIVASTLPQEIKNYQIVQASTNTSNNTANGAPDLKKAAQLAEGEAIKECVDSNQTIIKPKQLKC